MAKPGSPATTAVGGWVHQIEPIEKAMLVAQGMEKRRALDVMILDMRELTTICDYFVICHGRSQTHVEAISETVRDHLSEHGLRPNHIEGRRGATWVILDCGSTVGHIFTEDTRDFYDLERLWEGAPVVDHLDGGQAAEAVEADGSEDTQDEAE